MEQQAQLKTGGAVLPELTAKQRELLEAFRETETGEECPQSRGFFDKVKEFWDDLTE